MQIVLTWMVNRILNSNINEKIFITNRKYMSCFVTIEKIYQSFIVYFINYLYLNLSLYTLIISFVLNLFYNVERAEGLGKLGLSYGLGMVLGPIAGGFITKHLSEQSAALVACFLSIISIISIFIMIPKKTKALGTTPPDTPGK